jgi:hypothetical protein
MAAQNHQMPRQRAWRVAAFLSHLPPSTPDEVRVMTRRAGLDLPEELMQQFIAVWPASEAMVRRIPRDLGPAAEPAHSYRPLRIVRG